MKHPQIEDFLELEAWPWWSLRRWVGTLLTNKWVKGRSYIRHADYIKALQSYILNERHRLQEKLHTQHCAHLDQMRRQKEAHWAHICEIDGMSSWWGEWSRCMVTIIDRDYEPGRYLEEVLMTPLRDIADGWDTALPPGVPHSRPWDASVARQKAGPQ